MSLLSSAVSITRYRVNGRIEDPVTETVYTGLGRIIQEKTDMGVDKTWFRTNPGDAGDRCLAVSLVHRNNRGGRPDIFAKWKI